VIRFLEADDVAVAATQVLARSMNREAISPDRFVRQVMLDPNFRREGSILALDGEVPAGYALAVARQVPVEGVMTDPERGYLWLLGVMPEYRGRGIGTELLARAENYLRSQGRAVALASPYSPGYFQPGVDVEAYADGLRFLLARGYAEVYRPLAMVTSLWDLDVPAWLREIQTKREAEGVRIHRTGLVALPKLLEFARDEFGPDWVRYVRESMLRQLDGDRRTGLSVATEGEGENLRVLGFGHFDGERFGPIGTAKSERGRGLGQLLLWDVLAQQRERGFRTSWFLWSDDRTSERLYRQAGFQEVRRFAMLRKDLA
jgi:GNAT superfamily N-acetyltransferase